MAGGDGTQALVAGIAAEHGLPFLVISAGTRNHFALDLGLDRDGPSTCLNALTDGEATRSSRSNALRADTSGGRNLRQNGARVPCHLMDHAWRRPCARSASLTASM